MKQLDFLLLISLFQSFKESKMEIKTKHLGGFSANKPGVAHNPGHPEQKPGAAAGSDEEPARSPVRPITRHLQHPVSAAKPAWRLAGAGKTS